MLFLIAAFLGGLLLLTVGAYGLVGGASSLAIRFGISPLIVGLTVVAFGTSAPELVVSVEAAVKNVGGIAVGNVVGSNIANIGLILGIAALIRPLESNRGLLRKDGMVMIAASFLAALLLFDDRLGRLEGALLLGGLVAYLAMSVRSALAERRGSLNEENVVKRNENVYRAFLGTVGGLLLLVVGANLMVDNAIAIAESLEVSNAIIGLTVVAIGTSVPELATSLVAALRGESDIAVGNVVGSNTFNALGILGTASIVKPLYAPGLAASDLIMMFAIAAGAVILLATGARLTRLEGLGLVVAYGCYAGALALAF